VQLKQPPIVDGVEALAERAPMGSRDIARVAVKTAADQGYTNSEARLVTKVFKKLAGCGDLPVGFRLTLEEELLTVPAEFPRHLQP
jgi:hypothetical protein